MTVNHPINECVTTIGIMTGVLTTGDTRTLMSSVDGYIEFCHWVSKMGIEVEKEHERQFQAHERSDPGVWNYEVAEPIGEALAAHILSGEDYAMFDWRSHLHTLNKEFYK